MRCQYNYYVQPTEDEEKKLFKTTKDLVDFLNERIAMNSVYTSNMVQNYFKPRKHQINMKPNKLLTSLFHLTRGKSSKSITAI